MRYVIEIWKDIEGFEGLYQVSNMGKIKSCERFVKHSRNPNFFRSIKEKLLKQTIGRKGYLVVNLSKDGEHDCKRVSRLVAIAFVPNPDNKPEVNHKDGDKLNNNDWNLEWNTTSENIQHAYDNGLKKAWDGLKGETHGRSKLSEIDVLNIRKSSKLDEDLANAFGVKKSCINKIRNKQSWKHL